MQQKRSPLVSIITIVYNGEAFLERTMLSVISQTYGDIEYILIDGNSKDNTVAIIEKYKSKVHYWVSEPDNGLYDAMNKGLKAATGDYVLFINAGDVLADKNTIEKIFEKISGFPDVIYGETMMVDEQFRPLGLRSKVTPHQLPAQMKWQDMANGMVVCHQSILVKKSITDFYNTQHSYCGDIDWIIKALKKSNETVNVGFVISNYLKGGLSDKKRRESLIDRFNVLSAHFGLFRTIISHIFISMRALWFYNRKK